MYSTWSAKVGVRLQAQVEGLATTGIDLTTTGIEDLASISHDLTMLFQFH